MPENFIILHNPIHETEVYKNERHIKIEFKDSWTTTPSISNDIHLVTFERKLTKEEINLFKKELLNLLFN